MKNNKPIFTSITFIMRYKREHNVKDLPTVLVYRYIIKSIYSNEE